MRWTVALVGVAVLLAGCGGLNGDTTPTSTPDITDAPTPDATPTDTPETTHTPTDTESTPTPEPTNTEQTKTTETATWPPYDFRAGSSGDVTGPTDDTNVSAGGSGNVSAK